MGPRLENLEEVYRLGRKLGQGGFGVVYLAEDLRRGTPAAIKISTQEALPGDTERILRESALLAGLHHPRLAEFLGVYRYQGSHLALAYEFIPGEPLTERFRAAPPRPEAALTWVEDVAAALDALHARGVLHRDVKPANIMIDPEDRARLVDYGLARADRPGATVTATGVILGTPHFMSPEAIHGARPDRAGDVYGLAVTSYWLLTGRVPFPGESPVEILGAQQAPPPALRGFPGDRGPSLDAAMARALSPDPAARPASASELAALLRRAHRRPSVAPSPQERPTLIVGGHTPRAVAAVARTPTPQRVTRRGGRLGGSVALVLGLAMATGWFLTAPEPRPPPPPLSPAPSPTPPATSSATPFDTRFGERVRDRLGDLAGRFVDRQGVEVEGPAPGRRGIFELTGGDPQVFPLVIQRIPELVEFYRWLGAGGRPEELSRTLRMELTRADTFFQDQGLPRPFGPVLAAAPADAPRPFPEALRDFAADFIPGIALPDRTTGWLASGLTALDRAHTGLGRRFDALRADPLSGPGEFQQGFALSGALVAPTSGRVISGAWNLDAARAGIEKWVGPEIDALQTGIYCLGRWLAETPDPDLACLVVVERLVEESLGMLLLSRLYQHPLPWLLGATGAAPGSSPPVAMLAHRLLRFRILAARTAGDREATEAAQELRMEVLRALHTAGRGGLEELLYLRACDELAEEWSDAGRYQETVDLFREAGSLRDPRGAPTWAWFQAAIATALQRLGTPGGLSRSQLRSLRQALTTSPHLDLAVREAQRRAQEEARRDSGVPLPPPADEAALLAALEALEATAPPP